MKEIYVNFSNWCQNAIAINITQWYNSFEAKINYLEHSNRDFKENLCMYCKIKIFWSKNLNFLGQTCYCKLKNDKS